MKWRIRQTQVCNTILGLIHVDRKMITTILQMILDVGFLVVPGLLVVDLLCRFRWRPLTSGFLDKLLLGFVLWSSLLTLPIVVLSMGGFDFKVYYLIAAAFAFVIASFWLLVSVKRIKKGFRSFVTKASLPLHKVSFYHLLLLLIFLLMVSIYHYAIARAIVCGGTLVNAAENTFAKTIT